MVYNVFLFITCFLQIFAAVISLRLFKLTKLNVSWVLISAGLVLMAIRSIINIIGLFIPGFGFQSDIPYSWGGIFISIFWFIGVFLIRKIFVMIREAEKKQRDFEKRLLNTIVQVEENERKRFATELHDGLGPILSSIKMGFSAISTDIKDKEIRENIEHAISEAIVTVREVSNNLSPHILNSFGIEKAVRNFLGKITLPRHFTVEEYITIGDKRYQSTREIVIYRVFCELFTNTLKHAEASHVKFNIDEIDGFVVLTYFDNGKGFDPDLLPQDKKAGNGYYNIISRVSSLKGTSVFRRMTDKNHRGMYVEIKIPVDDK